MGGVLGALPGMFIALVPLLLHELDVITSDQSQIGFIGVPMTFIGVFVGTLTSTAGTRHSGAVGVGVAAGFVVGLVGGLAADVALRAAGFSAAGLWLLLAPTAMIAGGALCAWLTERG